jgi:hypothetical protein
MNLAEWSETDRTALRRFYEAGDQWSWEELSNGSTPFARAARDWIEDSPPPRASPILLPRVIGVGSNLRSNWYAIAFNEAQAEELREHLIAFVGPAGTDFAGSRAALDPADTAESALAAWVGGRWVYRFSVLPDQRDVVRTALQRLQHVWRRRPTLRAVVLRTTEALLREFFAALVNRDETGAVRWLGELRASGRLSAENLIFLEVERLAVFQRWFELASMPQIALLRSMRRPRHITALLIEALWRTELADFAARGDAAAAVERFRSDFYPRNQDLLRARGNLSGTPVVLAFLLAAIADDPPRREQIPILLGLLPQGPDRSFAEAVSALAPATPPPVLESRIASPLELARGAFQRDDYDTAWLHLQQAPPSPESCSLLLECAYELQSGEAARTVGECLGELSEQEKHTVFASHRRRRAWDELQRLLGPDGAPPPADWEEWLNRLDVNPEWSRLLPIARQAAFDWSLADYIHAPQRVRLLSDRLLANRSDQAQETLSLALPNLLVFFLANGQGAPVFLPIYQNLLFLLGVSERFSVEDWTTTQTLLLAILDAGADEQVYDETVGALTEVWVKFGSPVRFDWALDTLDLLAAHSAPARGRRDAFFDAVRDSFKKEYRRVRPEHWEIFRWLASDLERAADYAALRPPATAAGKVQDSGVYARLTGKLVAIYTLTESAGARAKAILEELFPGAKVRLSHEHGGSERLKSLAREADYFVVATRSATHAATEFLNSERPRGKSALIYPSGKGSSSIVSALRVALEAEFAN